MWGGTWPGIPGKGRGLDSVGASELGASQILLANTLGRAGLRWAGFRKGSKRVCGQVPCHLRPYRGSLTALDP